jgi:predicted TPR repeat methyltransferase
MRPKWAIAALCFVSAIAVGQDETDLLSKYERDLKVSRQSSKTNFRIGEIRLQRHDYQAAANSFREALNGDLQPKWIEVWSHVDLGKIFDITGQRDRAINEYHQAQRTKDDTRGALDEAETYLQFPYPKN